MTRKLLMMSLLGSTACLPPAEDAGQVDPTESGDVGTTTTGSDDSSGNDDAPPPEADIEATVEIGPGAIIWSMIRTPNGVLVAILSETNGANDSEVREYSSSLELLWSQQLPGTVIYDLEDLGGGELLAVGSSNTLDEWIPTAWRLSCCSAPVSQQYPQDVDYSWIIGAERRGDGLLFAIYRGVDAALVQVPMALAPASEVDFVPSMVYDAAHTSQGTVLLRTDGGDYSSFLEVGADGVMGVTAHEDPTIMVGKGDELTLMGFGENEVMIMPYDGDEDDDWVELPTPGFVVNYDTFGVDRHDRVVLVHGESYSDEPSPLTLVEFDDDGTTLRTRSISPVQYERFDAPVVAVGEDQAIYLGTYESDGAGQSMGYLHRIAPL